MFWKMNMYVSVMENNSEVYQIPEIIPYAIIVNVDAMRRAKYNILESATQRARCQSLVGEEQLFAAGPCHDLTSFPAHRDWEPNVWHAKSVNKQDWIFGLKDKYKSADAIWPDHDVHHITFWELCTFKTFKNCPSCTLKRVDFSPNRTKIACQLEILLRSFWRNLQHCYATLAGDVKSVSGIWWCKLQMSFNRKSWQQLTAWPRTSEVDAKRDAEEEVDADFGLI